jgi:hypothetical protein
MTSGFIAPGGSFNNFPESVPAQMPPVPSTAREFTEAPPSIAE